MTAVRNYVARFLRDPSGATSIEYAVMAMVIAVALVTAFSVMGTSISSMWNSVASNVINAS